MTAARSTTHGNGEAPTGALGGSAGARVTTGGDYACRERVFAPPTGTLDVDWVVPAVAEAHPDAGHDAHRAATLRAWSAVRTLADEDAARGGSGRLDDVTAGAVLGALRRSGAEPADLDRTAARVVVDAVRLFDAH